MVVNNYGGFSFNGRHCSDFGIEYIPESGQLGRQMGEYEIFSTDTPARNGGYYNGNRQAPRVFKLRCLAEDGTRGVWSKILKWFDRDKVGDFEFDDYPGMVWRVRPTELIEAKTYPLTKHGTLLNANSRVFTLTLTAFSPFSTMKGLDLEYYGGMDAVTQEYLLKETGLISADHMPPTNFAGFQDTTRKILMFNPGNERAHLTIRLAGYVGEEGLYIYNKTTGQGCKFINITPEETSDIGAYVEANSEYGTVHIVSPTEKKPAYICHDEGFLHLAGGYPVERDLTFTYDGNTRQIICPEGLQEDVIGKYVRLTALWVRIEGLISNTTAIVDTTFSHSGTETSNIVLMNELFVTGSEGIHLPIFDFSYKPTFS